METGRDGVDIGVPDASIGSESRPHAPRRRFCPFHLVCVIVSLKRILTRMLRSSHAACVLDSPTRLTRHPTISLTFPSPFSRIVSMIHHRHLRHRHLQRRSRRLAPIHQPRSAVQRWRHHHPLLVACILPFSGLPFPNDHATYMGLRPRQDLAPPPQTSCRPTRLVHPANRRQAPIDRRMLSHPSSTADKAGPSAPSCKAVPEALSLRRRI